MRKGKIKDISFTIVCYSILIFIVFYFVVGGTTIVFSLTKGDVYFFPQNYFIANEIQNDNRFKDYMNQKDFTLKELNWITAKRKGDIWIFYIKVQDKEINTENEIDSIANEWDYYTNGDLYYDTSTKQIKIDLIGYGLKTL